MCVVIFQRSVFAHFIRPLLLSQEMLDTIADDRNTTPAPNQTNGRHRGSDPFSDVELGQTSTAGRNTSNGNNAYSDDPYAERRSDEVEDYEMEQQQVRHSSGRGRDDG